MADSETLVGTAFLCDLCASEVKVWKFVTDPEPYDAPCDWCCAYRAEVPVYMRSGLLPA